MERGFACEGHNDIALVCGKRNIKKLMKEVREIRDKFSGVDKLNDEQLTELQDKYHLFGNVADPIILPRLTFKKLGYTKWYSGGKYLPTEGSEIWLNLYKPPTDTMYFEIKGEKTKDALDKIFATQVVSVF